MACDGIELPGYVSEQSGVERKHKDRLERVLFLPQGVLEFLGAYGF